MSNCRRRTVRGALLKARMAELASSRAPIRRRLWLDDLGHCSRRSRGPRFRSGALEDETSWFHSFAQRDCDRAGRPLDAGAALLVQQNRGLRPVGLEQ